jgi:hypothetical protein
LTAVSRRSSTKATSNGNGSRCRRNRDETSVAAPVAILITGRRPMEGPGPLPSSPPHRHSPPSNSCESVLASSPAASPATASGRGCRRKLSHGGESRSAKRADRVIVLQECRPTSARMRMTRSSSGAARRGSGSCQAARGRLVSCRLSGRQNGRRRSRSKCDMKSVRHLPSRCQRFPFI